MLKAVLDTSILVSAFLKNEGVNAKVLLGAKDQYQLYLSEDILEETSLEITINPENNQIGGKKLSTGHTL